MQALPLRPTTRDISRRPKKLRPVSKPCIGKGGSPQALSKGSKKQQSKLWPYIGQSYGGRAKKTKLGVSNA
jgi:hypothetical protein